MSNPKSSSFSKKADEASLDQKPKERIYPIEKMIRPVEELIRNRPISGILLFLSVITALLWVNLGSEESYHHLWQKRFTLTLGDYTIDRNLHHWINEGLMAIFFFVVGLEIKREIILGELSSWKKASLPVAAAIGGMLMPALIYTFFNAGDYGESGWGVPMATDIAFCLGILSLLGNKVPVSLKIFLTALAIVDDLGAVLVIAFFYTNDLFILYLEFALLFFGLLVAGNLLGIRNTLFYGILGILGVWISFLNSGVHATLAGVIVAMTIPVKAKINEQKLIVQFARLLERFKNTKRVRGFYVSEKQGAIIEEIKQTRKKAESPLQKLENSLNPFVSFIVLPLFALANSGVVFSSDLWSSLASNVSLGIILGLILGKAIGIAGFSYLFVKSGLSELPKHTNWGVMIGAGIMGGIGFTMSIFISELAFPSEEVRTNAKMAILIASTIAAIIGMLVISLFSKSAEATD
jgi:NhaA family Na+:H+ antiporter